VTDQELILSALRQVGLIVAEHLESDTRDADDAGREIGRDTRYARIGCGDEPDGARVWAAGCEVGGPTLELTCHLAKSFRYGYKPWFSKQGPK
jgi:hypothetical protein